MEYDPRSRPLPRRHRWPLPFGAATIALAIVLSSALPAIAEAPGDAASEPEPAAEARTRATAHFEKGVKAFESGRYKDAIDAFLDAHREFPSPTLSFNAALAYEKLGDHAGALRFYREYLRQAADAEDRQQVEKRVGDLEQELRKRGVQQVTILSRPAGATVAVDSQPVGVTPWTGEIFPGRHQLRLSREGFRPSVSEFDLLSHRARDVFQVLEEEAPAAASLTPAAPTAPQRDATPGRDARSRRGVGPWTWIALGAGTAALGGAAVFEVLRRQSEEDVKNERTRVARLEAYDQMQSRQTTARVLAGVGAAALVAGGVLLYFDLSSGGEQQRLGGAGLGCGPHPAQCGAWLGATW